MNGLNMISPPTNRNGTVEKARIIFPQLAIECVTSAFTKFFIAEGHNDTQQCTFSRDQIPPLKSHNSSPSPVYQLYSSQATPI